MRIERHAGKPHFPIVADRRVLMADRPLERVADVFGLHRDILRSRGPVAQGLQDRLQIPDRDLLTQQRLEHFLQVAQRDDRRDRALDELGRLLLELLDEVGNLLTGEQLVGVAFDDL